MSYLESYSFGIPVEAINKYIQKMYIRYYRVLAQTVAELGRGCGFRPVSTVLRKMVRFLTINIIIFLLNKRKVPG